MPPCSTAARVDSAVEQPIEPSCRAVNCLSTSPDASILSLRGWDTNIVRSDEDLSLLYEQGVGNGEVHALSCGDLYVTVVNRRVAVKYLRTQEIFLSAQEVNFVACDIAVGASRNLCNVSVAVVGCHGVLLWLLKQDGERVNGQGTKLDGPVHLPGTKSIWHSRVAMLNSTVAASSETGSISIWDDISEGILNKDLDQARSVVIVRRPVDRLQPDKVTELCFSKLCATERLSVAWWSGCVEVYQHQGEDWPMIWCISRDYKSTLQDLNDLGHTSSGAFAAFATSRNLVAVNAPDGNIQFMRSSDGTHVWTAVPDKNAGEVKGLAATETGVLVWNRGSSSLRFIAWPIHELAQLTDPTTYKSPSLVEGSCTEPLPSLDNTLDVPENIVGNTIASMEGNHWRSKLYEVFDVIVHHWKGKAKLHLCDVLACETTKVPLPFGATTLSISGDNHRKTINTSSSPTTLIARDAFATHTVFGMMFPKTILIYRVSAERWSAIISDHFVERGALSVNRFNSANGVVAGVSSSGEVWRWDIETLTLVNVGAAHLPGPAFGIISCTCGSGTFVVLGWRYLTDPGDVNNGIDRQYLALILPEQGGDKNRVMELDVPYLSGSFGTSPGCLLVLWKTKMVFVILFEMEEDLLLAASYNATNFEFVDSKLIQREEEQVPLAFSMMT